MEKFKVPTYMEGNKRSVLKLWDNIEKTIRTIRDLGLPKEVKDSLDVQLKKMVDCYASCDLNNNAVHIPDWMLNFNPYEVKEVNDVPRFKYQPKL